jgi:hypothetical protein
VFGREGQPQDVVQKAEQTEFPGFEKPAEKPKEKPKAKPKMEIRGTRRVMGDWQAIPAGKHGGQRRKRGTKWEYRYPAKGGGWSATPQKAEPKKVVPKAESKPAPKRRESVEDIPVVKRGKPSDRPGEKIPPRPEEKVPEVKSERKKMEYKGLRTWVTSEGKGTSKEELEQRLAAALETQKQSEIFNFTVKHVGRNPRKWSQSEERHVPEHDEWEVSIDHQAAIPGHSLTGYIETGTGVVSMFHDKASVSKQDYNRAQEGVCDVCKTKRRRNFVYVVEREADKKHLLVGGECAKKFKGANLVSLTKRLDEIDFGGIISDSFDDMESEDGFGGGRMRIAHEPHDVLGTALWLVRQHGYVGTRHGDPRATSTALQVSLIMSGDKKYQPDKKGLAEIKAATAEVKKDLPKIQEWIRESIPDDPNAPITQDVAFAVSTDKLLSGNFIDDKHVSRVAWIPHRYYKVMARREQKAKAKAYKAPHAKMHDLPGEWTILSNNVKDSQYGSYNSITAMDKEGHKIWFRQTSAPDLNEGDKVTLRGKVKSEKDDITFMSHMKAKNISQEEREAKFAEEAKAQKAVFEKRVASKDPKETVQIQMHELYSPTEEGMKRQEAFRTKQVKAVVTLAKQGAEIPEHALRTAVEYYDGYKPREKNEKLGSALRQYQTIQRGEHPMKAAELLKLFPEVGRKMIQDKLPKRSAEYLLERSKEETEKSWDTQLEQLRPRLILRKTSHPMELVWMAEEIPDELHETHRRTPPGWPAEDGMEKAVGHRYVKRVPTGKPKPKYRYWYRIPGKGLTSSKDIQQGSKFKVEHQGALGHFEVVHHDEHNNVVSVKHDESGRVAHIRERDLHRMITSHHEKQTKKVTKPKEEPKPEEMKLRREEQQPELPGTGKAEKPKAEKPKAPPKKLPRASMEDLGKGGFDNIEGFSKDAKELELQASQMKTDREFAVIPQPGGFVLASRKRAPGKVKESPGDKAEFLMRDTKGSGITKDSAEYVVMEAADVIASHDSQSFDQRKDYPEGVQERRYHDVPEEQNKIDRIARSIEPSLVVNTNPDAINGTPIVTEDGVVLGGNGRTMGMQRAYKLYPESGKKLKEYLIRHARAFGVPSAEVAGMKEPILVRRMKAGKDTDKLRGLGRRMNEALTQGMDPRTMEVALGQNYVTPELLDSLSHNMGDETLSKFLGGARSRPFISSLERAGIIDQFNRAEFVDKKTGLLNEDGRLRVERVLTARMLPDASVLSRMGSRLRGTIAKSVPSFIQMEKGGWDVRKALDLAVRADNDMRLKGFSGGTRHSKEAGKKIKIPMSEHRANYSKQSGLFGEEAGEEDLPGRLQKNKTAQAMLAALQDKADKNMPSKWRGIALEADRQKHGSGGFAAFAPEKKSLEDSIREVFELEVPKAEPKQAGLALSMPQPDLLKAEDGKALTRYLMHAVVWEANNLIRQAVAANAKLEGARLLERLRRFVLDQAKSDKRFAQALGAHPLNESDLKALLKASAMAHTAELAKSLAASSLWNDWSQAYAG